MTNSQFAVAIGRPVKPRLRLVVASAALVALIAAMALDTKVVRIGAGSDVQSGAFSPVAYGKAEFPKVQAAIEGRAVDAATLATAIAKDQAAAAKSYGVEASAGPEMAVKFKGVAGTSDAGVYRVSVDGVPATVLLQTGPAINGTDLRDATGTVSFGQFTNQIEYQNAGSALNREMKKQILSKLDTGNLTGKTLSVVGVFQLIDKDNWLVTPVKLDVQ